jgi:hypothetical protein
MKSRRDWLGFGDRVALRQVPTEVGVVTSQKPRGPFKNEVFVRFDRGNERLVRLFDLVREGEESFVGDTREVTK